MSLLIWNAYSMNVCPEEDIARKEFPFDFEGVKCFERASFLTAYDIFWDVTEIVRFFRPDDLFFSSSSELFAPDPEFVEERCECSTASGGNVAACP